jgi:hypothetical protein
MVTQNKGYQLEMKIRNNCYVLFVGGILLDHLLVCFDRTGEQLRQAPFLALLSRALENPTPER